jgi:hypothetical protein
VKRAVEDAERAHERDEDGAVVVPLGGVDVGGIEF